ncbi:MAG TPA: trehalose-6-phosphate synthase [Longimicrobiales bacterium]
MTSRRSVIAQPDRPPPLPGGRVLIVSNRLPVTARVERGVIRTYQSAGGLAAGLRQLALHWPVVWFGWQGLAGELDTETGEIPGPGEGNRTISIPLTQQEVCGFYRRYCNSVLWPILHRRMDEAHHDPEDWQTYCAVNERYAETVLRHLQPGDRVWVHDYHLFLVPRFLRERRPTVPVAFFLHTPFPEPEVFREIPESRELLEGMLGADVLGFHTEAYRENFLRAVRAQGWTVEGSSVRVGRRHACVRVHPMGVDAESFARLAADPEVLAVVDWIRANGGAILLGVDRLDYIKGIPERLLAFERLLQEHPELRGRVSLLQVAVPSREELGAYRRLREYVEGLVLRINYTYARAGWTPVDYLHGSVDLNTLVALYRAADVMVITSLRDGLNLVAKEFIATRTDGDGVLILSEFAGAAAELEAALRVDPNDVDELARAYYRALTMPEAERRRRMRELRRAIEANSVLDWAADFMERLPAAGDLALPEAAVAGVAGFDAAGPEAFGPETRKARQAGT